MSVIILSLVFVACATAPSGETGGTVVREGTTGVAAQAAPQITGDFWRERLNWADGSHTNYVLAHNWDTLEQYLRNYWSINIDIDGAQWGNVDESRFGRSFSDMMRRYISAAPDNRVTSMSVFTTDEGEVFEVVVTHAERQSGGDIHYWYAFWNFQTTAQAAESFYNRGNEHFDRGDFAQAIAYYTEAIRLNPNHALAFCYRGLAHAHQGNHTQAIADTTEAIRLAPNNAVAFNTRGVARAVQGDLARALADFNEAIRLNPNLDRAFANRGRAHEGLGDFARAIADWETVLRLNPNHPHARGNIERARQAQRGE